MDLGTLASLSAKNEVLGARMLPARHQSKSQLWFLLLLETICLFILLSLLASAVVLSIQKDVVLVFRECYMDCKATNGTSHPTAHLHPEAKLTILEAANNAYVYARNLEGTAYLKDLVKLLQFFEEGEEVFEFFAALAFNAEWFYGVSFRRLGFKGG